MLFLWAVLSSALTLLKEMGQMLITDTVTKESEMKYMYKLLCTDLQLVSEIRKGRCKNSNKEYVNNFKFN